MTRLKSDGLPWPEPTSACSARSRAGPSPCLHPDLSPIAKREGMLPVYADVWLPRAAPLDSINHALEAAPDNVTVPAVKVDKLARTPLKKIAAAGASLEFGDEPKRRALPAAPELRLDLRPHFLR